MPSDKTTSTSTSTSSSPPRPSPPPPPPPSSSSSASSSWTELAAREEAEAIAAAAKAAETHAKPFTTPEGFRMPSIGEQFSYASRRHPYARLGYAAVLLTGCCVWWLASGSDKGKGKEAEKQKVATSGAKS